MSSVTGNLCNKCPKWLVEQNSSYSDYFNAISGLTSNSRAPRGPVTFAHYENTRIYDDLLLTTPDLWPRGGTRSYFLSTAFLQGRADGLCLCPFFVLLEIRNLNVFIALKRNTT